MSEAYNGRFVSRNREPIARDLPLPAYATEQAAGMDLMPRCHRISRLPLRRENAALISTGLRIILPPGMKARYGRAAGGQSSAASVF